MSEFHPDVGFNKDDYYRMAVRQTNKDFDKKLNKKSFFTNISTIEKERAEALSKLEKEYYGNKTLFID